MQYKHTIVESTEVHTSVDQPTTLVIKLPDDYEAEVVWKKDAGETVSHSVLPDGSLYIVNTDLSDEGEYTVIVSGDITALVLKNFSLQ